jgi:hypothetical protein
LAGVIVIFVGNGLTLTATVGAGVTIQPAAVIFAE